MPGAADIFGILAQAPIDTINLTLQHINEAVSLANMQTQQVVGAFGLPVIPLMLPELPLLPSVGAAFAPATGAGKVTAAAVGAAPAVYRPVKPRMII